MYLYTPFMKSVLSFLMIAILMLHSSSKVFIYMDFCLNRNYIAQNLCENRNNPDSHCAGSCYLKKELKKDSEQQQKYERVPFQTSVYVVPAVLNKPQNNLQKLNKTKVSNYIPVLKLQDFVESAFHPPLI